MDPNWLSAVATTLAALVAAIALVYGALQLRWARKAVEATQADTATTKNAAQGDFLLHLEELWAAHWSVHLRLRPGGGWTQPGAGPETNGDWAKVEHYMGLFERINQLIEDGPLKADYTARFYGYRLQNLWRNDRILQKILKYQDDWHDFIQLSSKVVGERPGRFDAIETGLKILSQRPPAVTRQLSRRQ